MESTTRRRRGARMLVAGVGTALLLAGCGFDAQTLQPYTPAHGVNATAGPVKVRNLLVVSDAQGKGIVSASLVSPDADRLTAVSGTPIKADGTTGSPLQVSSTTQVALQPNQLVVLTEPQPVIQVSSPDLTPGLTVNLTLRFSSGVETTLIAPVASFTDPIYATVSPTPMPSTATPTPSVAGVTPPAPGMTPAPTTTP